MTTTIENLNQLTTTTQEKDTQYWYEVIQGIRIKRKPGRPNMYTPEELLERKRASDKRRYDLNSAKKKEAHRQWRQ